MRLFATCIILERKFLALVDVLSRRPPKIVSKRAAATISVRSNIAKGVTGRKFWLSRRSSGKESQTWLVLWRFGSNDCLANRENRCFNV